MVYTEEETKASYAALIELSECLNKVNDFRNRFVLTGGWAPYFITKGYFNHTGSRDIDMVLSIDLMNVYPTIIRSMTQTLGYTQTRTFEFHKTVKNVFYEVHFLCEPTHAPSTMDIYTIQPGLAPVVFEGCSLAFEYNFPQDLGVSTILVSGPVASFALKIHAFKDDLSRNKDPYDIYAILDSVENICEKLKTAASKHNFVENAINHAKDLFKSESADGPLGAADYLLVDPNERREYAARVFNSVNSVLRSL